MNTKKNEENKMLFTKKSSEYCTLLENMHLFTTPVFLFKCQELLGHCYTSMLRIEPPSIEEEIFPINLITEEDWFTIHDSIKDKLKEHNSFREVFDPHSDEADGALEKSIAEELSDIWQDLKNYTEMHEDTPNESLWVCQNNFQSIWGQKTVNVMRAIHSLIFSEINWDEEA